MITYETSALGPILEELKPILHLHYEEVAENKDKISLNPDYDKYLAMDAAGILHTVLARDGEKIIGYFICFVTPHIHYKDHLFASNDILFIHPDYRKGRAGIGLFKFAEQDLKAKGVSVLIIHMKVKHPFDPLCIKLGYTNIERLYSKYIGD